MNESRSEKDRKTSAQEYARVKRSLYFAELGITGTYLLVWLITGLSSAVRDALNLPLPLQIAAYVILFIGAHTVVTFPLSLYSDHILPRKYGLSVQSLGSWLADVGKSLAISVAVLLLAVELIYWLMIVLPTLWWLPLGIIFLFFTVVLANLGPILIVPLFFKLTPLNDESLTTRLTALADRAKTKVRGVFTMQLSTKTTTANAALMGLGNTRRIVLGDTLLNHYSPEEIEAVLAHELGHHVHRDIPKGIALESAATMLGFYLTGEILSRTVSSFGFQGIGDIAGLPLLAIIMGVFMFLFQPAANAYSRRAERAADLYALEMTGRPLAFETMMAKLADQNLSEPDPSRWVEIMFYSHPPYQERVKMARNFAQTKSRLS